VPSASVLNNRHPSGQWVARIARTFGGFVGAVWLGMVLASSNVVGALTSRLVLSGSAHTLIAAVVGFAIGTPLAFGIVLALGWSESRPMWPVVGFVLGSQVSSALLITAVGIDVAGAPSQPDLAWWAACTSALVLGAFGALAVIQRRRAHQTSASSRTPQGRLT